MVWNRSQSAGTTRSVAGPGPAVSLPPVRRRFTLRGVFLLTTYCAGASALASEWGCGVFVALIGGLAIWLSHCGYLHAMQSNSARPRVFLAAWMLFGVSLALPAITVTGCGNAPPQTVPGWQVATSCAMLAVETAWDAGDLVSQGRQTTFEGYRSLIADIFAAICFNLPNCLMLFSPFLLWRQQRDRGVLGHYLMGLAAIISWSWGLWASEGLRIGYYVWSSGITLLSLTRWPSRRMLVSLISSAAVAWLILSWL